MRTTQSISIELPADVADMVKAKVASGEYATASDMVLEGLQTLVSRDDIIDSWLKVEAAAAYDAHKADPPRAVPLAEAMARIRSRISG